MVIKHTSYIGIENLIFNKTAVKNEYFKPQDLASIAETDGAMCLSQTRAYSRKSS